MEIYLDHPYNGAKVVYSPAEAEALAAHGWKVRDPQPGAVKQEEPAPVSAPDAPIEPEPPPVRPRKVRG